MVQGVNYSYYKNASALFLHYKHNRLNIIYWKIWIVLAKVDCIWLQKRLARFMMLSTFTSFSLFGSQLLFDYSRIHSTNIFMCLLYIIDCTLTLGYKCRSIQSWPHGDYRPVRKADWVSALSISTWLSENIQGNSHLITEFVKEGIIGKVITELTSGG